MTRRLFRSRRPWILHVHNLYATRRMLLQCNTSHTFECRILERCKGLYINYDKQNFNFFQKMYNFVSHVRLSSCHIPFSTRSVWLTMKVSDPQCPHLYDYLWPFFLFFCQFHSPWHWTCMYKVWPCHYNSLYFKSLAVIITLLPWTARVLGFLRLLPFHLGPLMQYNVFNHKIKTVLFTCQNIEQLSTNTYSASYREVQRHITNQFNLPAVCWFRATSQIPRKGHDHSNLRE